MRPFDLAGFTEPDAAIIEKGDEWFEIRGEIIDQLVERFTS